MKLVAHILLLRARVRCRRPTSGCSRPGTSAHQARGSLGLSWLAAFAERLRGPAAEPRIRCAARRYAVLKKPVLIAALLGAACSGEPSDVFVPGPGFRQSIQLSTAQGDHANVVVGQPLVLHAERRSGPWVLAERASLPPESCWLVSAPAELELEVAGSLRWLVEPPEAATFNVDLRLDQTREVRFLGPGVYHLSAESSGWCSTEPYAGNTLTVEVVGE